MKTLVELIRSPQAGEDRQKVKKLRDGQEVRRRWAVRRREGGLRRGSHRAGARVLPYMDDFMVITKTQDDAFVQGDRVSKLLPRLGLFRNEKKGHWEPTQLVEHLGLEVDFEDLFRSVYLALPTARLYLRELYFVLGKKSSWGSKVKLTRQAWGDLQWWAKLPATSRWNGRKIWRGPTRAKLHTDSSLLAWGGVLNLKKEARGFWNDDLQKLHITHLELKAVYKTGRSFLSELKGKVVRLYCDNQVVMAMLSHFTSRNPELMRRMRKLWLLLDLHDIELQARYIRGKANKWADRLSRDKDLDDWRINKRWFKCAEEQWCEHSVDRFASEISAQLPRYNTAWHDPGCEGVDSLAYDWRGEHNWVNPPWGLLDEVAHKLREEGAAATVVAPYWPGQSWFRELQALAAEVIGEEINKPEEARPGCKIEVFWPEDRMWYPGIVGTTAASYSDSVEDCAAETLDGEAGGQLALRHSSSDAGNGAGESTADNYEGHWKKFVKFCTEENLQWLPATAVTVQLYMAALQKSGTVKGTSLQPYLSAINSFHEDFDYQGPSKGRAATRAVKGMTAMRTAAAEQQNVTETGGLAELHELLDRWEQTRDEDWLQAASTSTAKAADTGLGRMGSFKRRNGALGSGGTWRRMWEEEEQVDGNGGKEKCTWQSHGMQGKVNSVALFGACTRGRRDDHPSGHGAMPN
ncbi:hypothetical protein CYMTET_24769 [Cymbomonas tetramitiformis]|uniref:Core-binding (CB) domain-containing protein n=1 Tax=Cymbomonas tetramitiformis TaxID=36881 RepID=A0AAE0FV78_9CHLO|nr:hypothetical protein CYMTET_24769 [Cymbomonas tetramitiformis]